jgi:hypothetical protein
MPSFCKRVAGNCTTTHEKWAVRVLTGKLGRVLDAILGHSSRPSFFSLLPFRPGKPPALTPPAMESLDPPQNRAEHPTREAAYTVGAHRQPKATADRERESFTREGRRRAIWASQPSVLAIQEAPSRLPVPVASKRLAGQA